MGFFSRKSSNDSVNNHGYIPGQELPPLDLTGGSPKAEPREIHRDRNGDISYLEYARGGVMHGLNRNADGSPETAGQHMRREKEEKERESRWRNR
ncbi:hypothetical protein ACIRRH_43730 [Kitasatospora sp. NPDC101235]|uniref:hypothetical protein n=1 Tax=Kitasatospora sp. NPDC101235 TaxID=3364101 RepID=UPI0038135982